MRAVRKFKGCGADVYGSGKEEWGTLVGNKEGGYLSWFRDWGMREQDGEETEQDVETAAESAGTEESEMPKECLISESTASTDVPKAVVRAEKRRTAIWCNKRSVTFPPRYVEGRFAMPTPPA